MAQTKILLNNMADFGDFFISFYFKFSELGCCGFFPHNAVLNAVFGQEAAIRFAKISLVCAYLFNRLLGMKAIDSV